MVSESITPTRAIKWPAALKGITARDIRLGSGLVLMTFVTGHLINLALGLVSLDLLDAGQRVFVTVWRSPPGFVLLFGSLIAHIMLALWSLYRRQTLNMGPAEAAQLVLGLAIPLLLIPHLVGTAVASRAFGVEDSYRLVLLVLWVDGAGRGLQQVIATVVVWGHGCIGLYMWLRLKPWCRRIMPVLYGVALVLPVLALLGYVTAGRAVARLAAEEGWRAAFLAAVNAPGADALGVMALTGKSLTGAFAGMVAIALVARVVRRAIQHRRGVVRISYPNQRTVDLVKGPSILDASQANGIPHAHVCGGRGRCSTCRVRVLEGADNLSPAEASENKVLRRINAAPNVRLACQAVPHGDVKVAPLLPANATARRGHGQTPATHGQDREIAIMFVDIRSFTTLSEGKLPYDVVFILNRYFEAMGEAIEAAGGQVDKFIGDGVMALFGVHGRPMAACAQALNAARGIAQKLDHVNTLLAADLDEPLRIGIGIHSGPAIVGEMGYRDATSVTAIGDAVNTASRLEAVTKEYNAQLVLSQHVADMADADLSAYPSAAQPIRGRVEPLEIRIVADARTLPEIVPPVRRTRPAAPATEVAPAPQEDSRR